jgi:hypothetical protein
LYEVQVLVLVQLLHPDFMYPRLVVPWRRWFGIGKDWQINNRAHRNRAPASAAFMAVGAAARSAHLHGPALSKAKRLLSDRSPGLSLQWRGAQALWKQPQYPHAAFFSSETDGTVNASEGIK